MIVVVNTLLTKSRQIPNAARRSLLTVLLTAIVGACAAPDASRAPARIEVQEDVGFTITEEQRISANSRTDYAQALINLELGQYQQGIELLTIVVEQSPTLTAPRIDLGIAYHRSGELQQAEENLLQALVLNPDHPIAHNEIGIIYRKTGRFPEARASYEAALAVYPGYHFARRNLAVLCDLYLADLQCALENYEAYMATVPGDDEASMWIADIRNRIGQ